jgi:MFS transporter, PAT family, beta-lactamase induction signal transducer AmpG
LTALAALGRTVFALGTGYLQHAVGWAVFFIICAFAGLPALGLLAWLQKRRHFDGLAPAKK